MSEMRRWHRFVLWLIARLDALLPDAPDECGLLARSGDVYCTLPEDHDGLHGWDQPWTQHPEPMRPEPGADAALRLYGFVNISYSDTDPGDMGEPRVFQSDGEWYVTVPSWAALARPTPALDVEALDIRWLLDNSNPMHYQGCEPDGCSCGVSAKYEAISDRQAVREELAARATEGGTDR